MICKKTQLLVNTLRIKQFTTCFKRHIDSSSENNKLWDIDEILRQQHCIDFQPQVENMIIPNLNQVTRSTFSKPINDLLVLLMVFSNASKFQESLNEASLLFPLSKCVKWGQCEPQLCHQVIYLKINKRDHSADTPQLDHVNFQTSDLYDVLYQTC